MKKLILPFLLILLAFSCKEDDPCEGVICVNGGTCSNGTCQCTDHYEGSFCQEQETPDKIIIEKIVVTKFPATELDGAGWDLTDGPDLAVAIAIGSIASYVGDVYWENATQKAYTFTPTTQLEVAPLTTFHIAVLDYDDLDSDDFMAEFAIVPYDDENKFPDMLSFTSNDSRVQIELHIGYKF